MVEKDYFVSQVVKLSKLYFAEVLGLCCMGNHFHLLVRMHPQTDVTDAVKELGIGVKP